MTDEIPRNGVSIKGVYKFLNDLTEKAGYKDQQDLFNSFRPLHKHELVLQ